MGSNRFFEIVFLFFLMVGFVGAVDTSRFEYVSSVKVNCEEYKGYARFELPNEFSSISSPVSYMDVDYSVSSSAGGDYFRKSDNWYVNQISGFSVAEVEKIFDLNYGTYLLTESGSSLEFVFENPASKVVDKISIDVRDSVINSVNLYDGTGKKIDFELVRNLFHYELILKEKMTLNNVRFVLNYENVLKLKEVVFYEKQSGTDKSYVYFYVDNNCADNFLFYFGRYGESNLRRGDKVLPVEFEVEVTSVKNIEYISDFDNDGLANGVDNCLDVTNADQKDINYNKVGDACEDDDRDGVMNSVDNCVEDYNRDQMDGDGDGIGNACDDDDGRFFEKNGYLIYIMVGIVAVLFVGFAVVAMKKK